MGKLTIPETYLLQGNRVEIMPYFLYEVSVYKSIKGMAFLIGSQYYKSNRLLNIKKETTVKKCSGYSVVRYISVLGVTKEFVDENRLQLYQPIKKKKKK